MKNRQWGLVGTIVLGSLLIASSAFAASTGAVNAGTGSNDNSIGTVPWTNPGNITTSVGSTFSTATVASPIVSNYLKSSNYGFSIPAGATINGIQVTILRGSSTGSSIKDNVVKLVKGGTVTGNNKAIATVWQNSNFLATYGSSSDLWGATWTPADINASNFGAALSVASNSGTNHTGSVDYMQITVTYTLPDTTAPTITASITGGTTGLNSWYTSNVTVHYTCADDMSGVASCPSDVILNTEGTNISAPTPTISDNAGNISAPSNQITVKIDKTAPVIMEGTPTGTAGANNWYISDVTVPFSVTDNLSGFDMAATLSTSMASKTTSGDGAALTVTSDSISDMAGNTAAGITSENFMVDQTAPTAVLTITAGTGGTNGWYKSAVTVSTTGIDAVSGVSCDADQYQNTETAGTVFNGSCTNGAGATTMATPITIMVDMTAPQITLTTPANNAVYLTNSIVLANYSATDALSGMTSTIGDVVSGSAISTTLGGHTFTVTAVDMAGNQAQAVNNYQAQNYVFGGFYAPVSLDSKAFKQTSTIPVKLTLTLGNLPYCSAGTTARMFVDGQSLTNLAVASGNSNVSGWMRCDTTSMQYIFNLSTKQMSKGTHTLWVLLDDGTWHSTPVTVK